jgi:hypothetical protein
MSGNLLLRDYYPFLVLKQNLGGQKFKDDPKADTIPAVYRKYKVCAVIL